MAVCGEKCARGRLHEVECAVMQRVGFRWEEEQPGVLQPLVLYKGQTFKVKKRDKWAPKCIIKGHTFTFPKANNVHIKCSYSTKLWNLA